MPKKLTEKPFSRRGHRKPEPSLRSAAGSGEIYREIFENMAAGCCVDEVIYRDGRPVDYRILEVNPAYERITGIPRDKAAGALASELYETEELPFFDVLVRVAETGEPAAFEAFFPLIGKHLSITVGSPGPGKFSTVFQDISDRILMKEDLQERERLLASVLESQQEMVCRYLPDTTLTFVNDAYCRFFGLTREELLGKKFLDLIPEAEHPGIREYLSGFTPERPTSSYSHPVRKKDGTRAWQEWVDNALFDSNDRIVEFQSSGRDITDRKAVEAELRESEERYRLLLESIQDSVFLLDREWRYRLVNAAGEKLTGVPRERLLGGKLTELFPGIEETPFFRTFRRVKKNWKPAVVEGEYAFPDGRKGWYEVSVSPAPEGILCIFRDITARKRAEEELLRARKLESLGVLAGGIAHDFNNALTAIIGNLSLARRHMAEGSELAEVLSEASAAASGARGLTKQLLTFSRGGEPVKETLRPGKLLREMAEFALSGSPVKCRYRIPGDLRPVEADRGQLVQVVSNLVINAAEAMTEGGEIEIRADNVELAGEELPPLPGGKYVRVEVEDRGEGIPGDRLEKIFDPYYTTKIKGNGLGLTTAYSIVTRHGGLIRAVSEPEEGSVFAIYLPASDREPPEEEEPAPLAGGAGRVLLMDDEERIRKMGRRFLEELGYRPETAADGEEAVAKYRRAREEGEPFAAVILDLTVPGGMGGEQALAELKKIDPGVRAVVSSGYSTDSIMARPGEFGFFGAIPKPYTISNMSRVLAAGS